jgi:uncharacterized OB-fold protein
MLEQPYWDALHKERLIVQRCVACDGWQWGPEWICHRCLSTDVAWVEVAPHGRIYSWERIWHPAHPALKGHGPYLAVLVELPKAGEIRMVGNLLGDPQQTVRIGAEVRGEFEHHVEDESAYSLLHWRVVEDER